jgi:FkbM family methyltransferase
MTPLEILSPLVPLESLKIRHEHVFSEILGDNYAITGFKGEDVKDAEVIDIGAHVGMFTMLCHAHGAKSIIPIEANPHTYNELISNLINIPTVKYSLNMAIFDGCLMFINFTDSGTESRIESDGKIKVPCMSLEEALSRCQGEDIVMKMDIEGAEYDVIPACSKSALRRCKRIFLETHVMRDNGNDKPGHTSVFLKEYLSLCGFKVAHYSPIFQWIWDNGKVKSCTPIPNFEMLKMERV